MKSLMMVLLILGSSVSYAQVHDRTCRATGQNCVERRLEIAINEERDINDKRSGARAVVEAGRIDVELACLSDNGKILERIEIAPRDFNAKSLAVELRSLIPAASGCALNGVTLRAKYDVNDRSTDLADSIDTFDTVQELLGTPFTDGMKRNETLLVSAILKQLPLRFEVSGSKVDRNALHYIHYKGVDFYVQTKKSVPFDEESCRSLEYSFVENLKSTHPNAEREHALSSILATSEGKQKELPVSVCL